MRLLRLNEITRSLVVTDTFKGLNTYDECSDGEFSDLENMTSENYPYIETRAPHTHEHLTDVTGPATLLYKDGLYAAVGNKLYFNGNEIMTLSNQEHQLVPNGAYLCIFPDGIFYNTTTHEIKQTSTDITATTSTLTAVNKDGTAVTRAWASGVTYSDGDMVYADGVVKRYSGSLSVFEYYSEIYTKVVATGTFTAPTFADGSMINISGGGRLSGNHTIYKSVSNSANTTTFIIPYVGNALSGETVNGAVIKTLSYIGDYYCQYNNRLWSCKYDGTLNEIHASYLGEPWEWNKYSTTGASYAVSCGTDGKFTGAITYNNHPLLFKEGCIHKVYVSNEGAHQIIVQDIKGVKDGSHNSLCIIEGYLYYFNSENEFVMYDGTSTSSISDKIKNLLGGNVKVSCCARGHYYYCVVKKDSETISLVYDTRKGIWSKEGVISAPVKAVCSYGSTAVYLNNDNDICVMNGGTETVKYSMCFAQFGYDYPEHKILSRIGLRAFMGSGSASVLVKYDDSEWIYSGDLEFRGTKNITLAIKPQRCDRMTLKLVGEGEFKLYSLSRILERGDY